MRPSLRALVAAVLIGLAPAGTAVAAPPAPDAPPHPSGGLYLTVSGANGDWIRGVRLRCSPRASGPHPEAKAACAALDRARGDLDALPVEQAICTKEYDPVTASATGLHRGHPINWHKTFENPCHLRAATGPVFNF